MKVQEIFYSVDGEGAFAGRPAIFIRLRGCNLRCNYEGCDGGLCDTPEALEFSHEMNSPYFMTIGDIIKEVKKYNCDKITLTGGEPLAQDGTPELVRALILSGYYVEIETNGSFKISIVHDYILKEQEGLPPYWNDRLLYTIDYKTKSSKMEGKMDMWSFDRKLLVDKYKAPYTPEVVYKIVVSKDDMMDCKLTNGYLPSIVNFLIEGGSHKVILSPIITLDATSKDTRELMQAIVDFIKEHPHNRCLKIGVQLHKVIWEPLEKHV